MKYQRKIEHIDAYQWTGKNFPELKQVFGDCIKVNSTGSLMMTSQTGYEVIPVGHYLFWDSGFKALMDPEHFELIFEPVLDTGPEICDKDFTA